MTLSIRGSWDKLMSPAAVRLRFAALSTAAAAALAALYVGNPAETHLFPPCAFHVLTGFYCPGCGMTRGLHHLLHGHVRAALAMNPLFMLFVPFVLYAYVRYAVRISSRGAASDKPADPLLTPRRGIAILLLLVCYGVLRNLPYYPFTCLAPH